VFETHVGLFFRWPSARPDSIVPEAEYKAAMKSFRPADVAKALTTRVPWERGIHQNYTGMVFTPHCCFSLLNETRLGISDVYGDQPLFANTDMAKRWHELGFIVQRPSSGPEPIFVETQRGDLYVDGVHSPGHHKHKAPKGGSQIPKNGGIVLPTPDSPEQPIMSVESLRVHLQTAMQVELSTIPLYLFGMYSVKTPQAYVNDPRYYDPIIGSVRGELGSFFQEIK
jgi:hypothetical protein